MNAFIQRIRNALFVKKEVWRLSFLGWSLILAGLGISFTCFVASIHHFLSLHRPVDANILIVEGWLPDYALKKAVAEFRKGKYDLLITTGGPIEQGSYLIKFKTCAEIAYLSCVQMGLDENKVVYVPAPFVKKDRTYAAAISLRDWLAKSNMKARKINLVSLGPHSRRSYNLFKTALGPQVELGIISIIPQEYDISSWWTSSNGVRTVISEMLAYFYALVATEQFA